MDIPNCNSSDQSAGQSSRDTTDNHNHLNRKKSKNNDKRNIVNNDKNKRRRRNRWRKQTGGVQKAKDCITQRTEPFKRELTISFRDHYPEIEAAKKELKIVQEKIARFLDEQVKLRVEIEQLRMKHNQVRKIKKEIEGKH